MTKTEKDTRPWVIFRRRMNGEGVEIRMHREYFTTGGASDGVDIYWTRDIRMATRFKKWRAIATCRVHDANEECAPLRLKSSLVADFERRLVESEAKLKETRGFLDVTKHLLQIEQREVSAMKDCADGWEATARAAENLVVEGRTKRDAAEKSEHELSTILKATERQLRQCGLQSCEVWKERHDKSENMRLKERLRLVDAHSRLTGALNEIADSDDIERVRKIANAALGCPF